MTEIAPKHRHVGASHIAFFRNYLNGIDLSKLAETYLFASDDPRHAATVLQWVRRELVMAARRPGSLGDARLIRIQPKIPDRTVYADESHQSLADWRTRQGITVAMRRAIGMQR